MAIEWIELSGLAQYPRSYASSTNILSFPSSPLRPRTLALHPICLKFTVSLEVQGQISVVKGNSTGRNRCKQRVQMGGKIERDIPWEAILSRQVPPRS